MPEINVVTTFSADGYRLYGRRCIASLVKYWPADVGVYIFYEPPLPIDIQDLIPICRPNIRVFDLTAETAISEFIADWGWHPRLNHPTDYRLQGVRFCHKVFAMTADCLPKSGIRIWLDADTETTKPVDHDYLKRCLPAENEVCSYLGRTQWHHSETGWLGFNLEHGQSVTSTFLDWVLGFYKSGKVAWLDETHDAWVFDHARRFYDGDLGWKFRNLSPNAVGLDAWNHSPLGERMQHYKGALKLR